MIRRSRLPYFIIVGTQKAGTSSLYNSFRHHLDLLPPVIKEIHFFDNDERFSKGLEKYETYFPSINRFSSKKTFEITPSYLYDPQAAGRIKTMLPAVKIIAVLRDPVRRAFSAWNMYHGFEHDPLYSRVYDPRSFKEAIQDELHNGPKQPYGYLARGYYAVQLSRYFDRFGRDNVLVLNYSELKNDRLKLLNRICAHVGISAYTGNERSYQARSNVRAYANPMDEEIKAELQDHFKPHMADLTTLLGEEFFVER